MSSSTLRIKSRPATTAATRAIRTITRCISPTSFPLAFPNQVQEVEALCCHALGFPQAHHYNNLGLPQCQYLITYFFQKIFMYTVLSLYSGIFLFSNVNSLQTSTLYLLFDNSFKVSLLPFFPLPKV